MDEQQFYIEDCIIGLWENDLYSFIFKGGNPKLMSITDRQNAPKTGTGYQYHIVKQDYYHILRLILADGNKVATMDYKIDKIDCSTGELNTSTDGVVWELKKVSI